MDRHQRFHVGGQRGAYRGAQRSVQCPVRSLAGTASIAVQMRTARVSRARRGPDVPGGRAAPRRPVVDCELECRFPQPVLGAHDRLCEFRARLVQ